MLQAETLHTGETSESLASRGHDAFGPEWIDGRFSCLFVCTTCRGMVGVVGKYRLVFLSDPAQAEETYYKEFAPRMFFDAPQVITVPEDTPDAVQAEIKRSFPLFWSDLDACGGCIRSSVERLLDHLKVRRTYIDKGRRKRLSLHQRIEIYRDTDAPIAEALMAVKWIGNAASHNSRLARDDVMDGYDLMAHVLRALFDRSDLQILRITRSVNGRRGPRSGRAKRA